MLTRSDADCVPQRADTSALVTEHLRLAHSLANRFARRGEDAEDLDQVAMYGLVQAARRFDATLGIQFSTFATRTIIGELKRHFRDNAWKLHVPRGSKERYLAVRDALGPLVQRLGRSPTITEISGHCGLTEEQVLEGIEAGHCYRTASLEASAPDDEHPGVAHRFGSADPNFAQVEQRELVSSLVGRLSVHDRHIVFEHFHRGRSQSDIATELGISQMQVSRVLSRILRRLRVLGQET
jgi:RNA polymerase sigma-B factor